MTNRQIIRDCSFNRCVAIFVCMLLGITFCVDTGADVITEPAAITGEKLVDNPVDAWLIAHSGRAGRAVGGDYRRRFEILDTTDFKQGDFSIKFEVSNAAAQSAFGFFTGQYIDYWVLDESFSLHLWAKAEAENKPAKWELAVYDTSGNRAAAQLQAMSANDGWKSFAIALKDMTCDSGFSFEQVRSVQVEAQLDKGACLRLDGVYFTDGKNILGVSDKTITQYMTESQSTRQKRIDEAMVDVGRDPSRHFVPLLWKGENLERVNQEILEYMEEEKAAVRPWGLWTSSALNWMYFGFSSQGRLKPDRLTPEAEKAMLDWMWDRYKLKNDIATTRRSSWYVAGSENHDVNLKMSALLSSQIFMNLPDYSERVYPNLGKMIGYQYGMNPEFLAADGTGYVKFGSGNFSDGKDYKPADHYKAWVEFWKEYFAERARHGFFIEHNANGYMSHTGRFLHDIYAWCEDEQLREQTRMFLDVMWAQWMQDQLITIQGGATTRGGPGEGRMGLMSEYFLGGPVQGAGFFYVFSDYDWNRPLWEMMLDRQGKGEFAFVSRKPNEEQQETRPAGTEYSLVIRPDSRLVRYSWVTPDYVFGLRLDHPYALYCHLSMSGQGITFATTPNATIEIGPEGTYHKAVQHRNVAILQPKSVGSVAIRHPEWFPGLWSDRVNTGYISVRFGRDIERIIETDGWVFVEEGNAFAAFRIVYPKSLEITGFDEDGFGVLDIATDTYQWHEDVPGFFWGRNPDGKMIRAKDMEAALIVETSRREHHSSIEEFIEDILSNRLELRAIIRGFLLTYQGGDENAELYMNCSNPETPKINGEYLCYESPTFQSPYLQGDFGSGVVRIIGSQTGEELLLDFNGFSPK